MKFLKAFGFFWYDFIVGDSMLLAIGGVAFVAIALILARVNASVAAEFLLPLIVVLTLWISVPKRR